MIQNEERPASASKKLRRRLGTLLPAKGRHPFVLDGVIAVAITLVLLWAYSPRFEIGFNGYDLGISVYGGLRVLDGFVPYAETHTPYGPAQFYIRALFFYLFGTTIETAELEYLVFTGIGVVAVYWALRGCAGRLLALFLTFVLGIASFYLSSLAFISMVLAVGCMTRYSGRQQTGWLVGAGAFIGLTGAARWDFGFYCAVVSVAVLASLPLIRRVAAPIDQTPVGLRVRARHFLLLLVPAPLAALPFYAPALLTDPWAIFRSIQIALGVHDYRVLPWPDLPSLVDVAYGELTVSEYLGLFSQSFPAYAFFFLGPLNAIAMLVSLRRGSTIRPGVPLVVHTLATTLLGACLLIYTDSRADLGHMLPSMTLMLLSLPLVFWLAFRSLGAAPLRALLPIWGGVILALLFLGPNLLLGILGFGDRDRPLEGLYTAPTLAGLSPNASMGSRKARERAAEYNDLVDYVKENTAPDEFIFSGNVRHDKVSTADVLIYFASERHAGFRDYHMDPGSTTRQDIQQQIISDLQSNDARLVVLSDRPPPQEPNRSVESSGVTDLDDYIHANYAVREQFGRYLVLTKRRPEDTLCSSTPASGGYRSVEQINPVVGGSEVGRDGQVSIQGWAATPEGSPPIDRIEVKVEDQAIEPVIQCIPRDDLAQRLGENARHSGWQVTADLRDIEEVTGPEVEVAVEAVDRDGERHQLPMDSAAKLRLMA